MHIASSALLLLLLLSRPAAAGIEAPTWHETQDADAEAGHVTLTWSGTGDSYELQHATDEQFLRTSRITSTADTQSFVSGLGNGAHYFRIRSKQRGVLSPWSPVLRFDVAHPSLATSLGLFGAGALVFVVTVAFTLTEGFGASRHARRAT